MRIQEHPILGTYEKDSWFPLLLMEKHWKAMPENPCHGTEKCRRNGSPLYQKRT